MNKEKKPRKKLTPGRIYAVVLAVVVLCCIMLSVLETRNGWEWDITVGNLYTLSDETVSVLEDVDTPINIYTLYSLGNYNKTILTLLEKYQFYCKNITVSNIDPMGDRLDVKELEGVGDFINEGALIVTDEKSGRSRVIDVDDLYMTYDGETYFFAENRITDAIDYVTTGSFRRILLTAGHRETSAEELDKFIKHMTMQNYIVEEYDYLHTTVVPDPATFTDKTARYPLLTATAFSGTSANVTALLNTLNANETSGSWRVRRISNGNGTYTLTVVYSDAGFRIIFR